MASTSEKATDFYRNRVEALAQMDAAMRNIELKARITDYERVCRVSEELSGGPPTIIHQVDTFYKVNNGRMKMRKYADHSATLVRYDRADHGGPKLSNYELIDFPVADAARASLLNEILKKSLGVCGKVVKERKLYMVDTNRIHIDTVQDLGRFIEVEVMLLPDEPMMHGEAYAWEMITKLGIQFEDLVDCAYVDLLNKKQKKK